MLTGSKVIARTDTQTDTHTHRHDENITSTAYAGGKYITKSIIAVNLYSGDFPYPGTAYRNAMQLSWCNAK